MAHIATSCRWPKLTSPIADACVEDLMSGSRPAASMPLATKNCTRPPRPSAAVDDPKETITTVSNRVI
jgi:hypothetical protein